MGSPMGPMNCGPMNCGPGMGSPLGPQRSPMVCNSGGGIMNCGPPQSSPMNHPMNRSPSVGSPLGPVMNAMGQSSGERECLSSIIPNWQLKKMIDLNCRISEVIGTETTTDKGQLE